jgi:hypothetical protein
MLYVWIYRKHVVCVDSNNALHMDCSYIVIYKVRNSKLKKLEI